MLYHTNFGPPLLEEGSRLLVPVETVTPLTDHAAKDVKRYDQFPGPTPGFAEQVYAIKPLADGSGRTLAVLRNKAGELARLDAVRHPRAAPPDALEEHGRRGKTAMSWASSRAPTSPTTAASSASTAGSPACRPARAIT